MIKLRRSTNTLNSMHRLTPTHAHSPARNGNRCSQGEQQDRPRELPPHEEQGNQVRRLHGIHRRGEDRAHHQARRETQGEGRPRMRHRGGRHRRGRLHQVREVRPERGQLQHRTRVPPGRQPRQEDPGGHQPGRLRRHLHRERREPRLPRRLPPGDRLQGRRHLHHRGGRHGQEAPRHLHPLRRRRPQQDRHRRRRGRGPRGHRQGLQQADGRHKEHLQMQR